MDPTEKELLIGLIGSTYGQLKSIDDSITGSSSTLNRRAGNVKQELTNILKGIPPPPDVPLLHHINQQPQPAPTVVTPIEVPNVAPSEVPESVQTTHIDNAPLTTNNWRQYTAHGDPNQLELPLEKIAKYDDIVNAFDRFYERMGKLEDKIDIIMAFIKSQPQYKKKLRGLKDS
jgi:hypothetical protein